MPIHLQWTWRSPKALRCLLSVGPTRAFLIPPFLASQDGPSGVLSWNPWMGMARFVLFSLEQEAFFSFSLQGCISGHLFIFSFPRCDVGSLLLGVIPSWPIAPPFLLGFQFLLISLRKRFKRVPVCCASALPVMSRSWSGPSAGEALLFALSSLETSRSASRNDFSPVKSILTPLKGPFDHGHVAFTTPAITQGCPSLSSESLSVLSAVLFPTLG